MNIKDIMLKKYIYFTKEDEMDTVIRTFLNTALHSIPVLDDEKKLIGFVHEKSIYTYLHPEIPEEAVEFDVFFELFKENQLGNRIEKLKGESIETLIEKQEFLSLDPEESTEEAIIAFSKSDVDQIPVITKTRRLIGFVRRKDLLSILLINE